APLSPIPIGGSAAFGRPPGGYFIDGPIAALVKAACASAGAGRRGPVCASWRGNEKVVNAICADFIGIFSRSGRGPADLGVNVRGVTLTSRHGNAGNADIAGVV